MDKNTQLGLMEPFHTLVLLFLCLLQEILGMEGWTRHQKCTLKILHSYAQLDAQGVDGENITAAKKRIEGMMDKVVAGFENQLDQLFRDSAMDISSDVAVLEKMLEKDGLSGNNGMTLGG